MSESIDDMDGSTNYQTRTYEMDVLVDEEPQSGDDVQFNSFSLDFNGSVVDTESFDEELDTYEDFDRKVIIETDGRRTEETIVMYRRDSESVSFDGKYYYIDEEDERVDVKGGKLRVVRPAEVTVRQVAIEDDEWGESTFELDDDIQSIFGVGKKTASYSADTIGRQLARQGLDLFDDFSYSGHIPDYTMQVENELTIGHRYDGYEFEVEFVDGRDDSTEIDQPVHTKQTSMGEFTIGFRVSENEYSVTHDLLIETDDDYWRGEVSRDDSAVRFDAIDKPAAGIGVQTDVLDDIESVQKDLDAESEDRRESWLDDQDELEFEAVEKTETTGSRTKYVTDQYLAWKPSRSVRTEEENATISELQSEVGDDGFSTMILVQDDSVDEGDTTTLSELVDEDDSEEDEPDDDSEPEPEPEVDDASGNDSKIDVQYHNTWQHGKNEGHGFHSFAVLEIEDLDETVVVKSRNVVDIGYQIFVDPDDDSEEDEVSEEAESRARSWARESDGIPDGFRMDQYCLQDRFYPIQP